MTGTSDIQQGIAEVLAESLNIAGPLGYIFGGDVGPAASVLVAQEIETAAAMLAPLVREAQREAWERGYGTRDDEGGQMRKTLNPYAEEGDQDE